MLHVWSVVPVQGLRGTGSKPTLVAPHPGLRLGVRGCGDVTLLAHVDGDDRLLMPGGVSTSCRGKVKAAELNEEPQDQRFKAADMRPAGGEPGCCQPEAAFPSFYISVGDLNNIKWPF